MGIFVGKKLERIFCLPVNRANTGHIVMSAHPFTEEPVSNFPSKHGWIIFLVLGYSINNMGSGHLGLWAPDDSSLVIASLIEPESESM